MDAKRTIIEEDNKVLIKEILRLSPKHKHDHEYFHDDCGLCLMEKDEWEERIKKIPALKGD